MKSLYLVAIIAGEQVAITAEQVDSVVKVRDAVPVPSAAPFIAGLFALRSRVLTLVDCQFFVTGEHHDLVNGQEAIVVKVGGYSYGLLVDNVLNVVNVSNKEEPLPAALPAGWSAIGSAMLEIDGKMHLVVDPQLLVNPSRRRAA